MPLTNAIDTVLLTYVLTFFLLGLSSRAEADINKKLNTVRTIRLANASKLTDISAISQHPNAPYLNRIIAIHEVYHEIESQLERISPTLRREAGESTYKYLIRLKETNYPSIPLAVIHRIAFLDECARFRSQKFDVEERMEMKSLLSQFMKIVGQFAVVGASSRRRTRFGGSDGVRLLVAEERIPKSSPGHHRRLSHTLEI